MRRMLPVREIASFEIETKMASCKCTVIWHNVKKKNTTTQHSTAQHSTTQHNTTQHSTAQHSTAQHNTAQHLREVVDGSDRLQRTMSIRRHNQRAVASREGGKRDSTSGLTSCQHEAHVKRGN